jgi:hypothetical protein
MKRPQSGLDRAFDGALKIGFMVVFVGLMMFYMPLLDRAVEGVFGYIDFWAAFNGVPPMIQVVVAGMMLVGAAVVVGTLKELVESMVHGLYGREE